jgi:hypothetical protein
MGQCFEADGHIVWCDSTRDGYEIGVQFDDAKAAFGVRMIEQVCHIEQYRREMLETEGRKLSSEEAASEWINGHAPGFPGIDPTTATIRP